MRQYHRLHMLWGSARREGFRGFARTTWRLARDVLFGQHRLVFGLYASQEGQSPATVDGREFTVSGIASVGEIGEELREELSRNRRFFWWDVDEALKAGSRLWLGYWEGRLACLLWTVPGGKQGSYFFPLTDRCTLVAHCVTLPEYRKRGCFTRGLKLVIASLVREGYHRFYVDCSDWNVPSRKAIERAGFRLIGHGKCRRKGRLIWYQEATPDVARLFTTTK